MAAEERGRGSGQAYFLIQTFDCHAVGLGGFSFPRNSLDSLEGILPSKKNLTKLSRKSTFSSMFRVWVFFMEYMHWNATLAEISKEDPATWVSHRRRQMWFLPSRNSWSGTIDKTIKEYQGHRFSAKSKQLGVKVILTLLILYPQHHLSTDFYRPIWWSRGRTRISNRGKMSVLHLTWHNLKMYGCKSTIRQLT